MKLSWNSEGGLVALFAAQDAPDSLCGLILLATPGRPVGQLLIEQLEANPQNASLMGEIRAIVTDLESGLSRDPASISAVLQPLFRAGVQGYLIDMFSHDPAVLAAGWRCLSKQLSPDFVLGCAFCWPVHGSAAASFLDERDGGPMASAPGIWSFRVQPNRSDGLPVACRA